LFRAFALLVALTFGTAVSAVGFVGKFNRTFTPQTTVKVSTEDFLSSTLDYEVNLWSGAGTSLVAPELSNTLNSLSIYFHEDVANKPVNFLLSSDFQRNDPLVQSSFTAVSGWNTILLHTPVEAGAYYYSFLDFGDYRGLSVYFTLGNVVGDSPTTAPLAYFKFGESWFWDFSGADFGDENSYQSLDLIFKAEFAAIPLPASGLLLLSAFGGLLACRRRKAA